MFGDVDTRDRASVVSKFRVWSIDDVRSADHITLVADISGFLF